MGISGKLVALGLLGLLLLAGIAGPLYPWVMEVVNDPSGDTATALTELHAYLWPRPVEGSDDVAVHFNKTKVLLMLALGAFVGVVSVRIVGRSKTGAATAA